MKKILMIAYSFPPNSTSGIYRIMHFAGKLAEGGRYEPHILTVSPDFYEPEVHMDPSLLDSVHPGVKIHRTRCVHLRHWLVSRFGKGEKISAKSAGTTNKAAAKGKKGRLQQIKDMVTDGLLSFPDRYAGWLPFAVRAGIGIIRREKTDVILATGAPWTSLVIGAILKQLTGVPLILDYRDPWIGNPFHGSRILPLFTRLSEKLEKCLVRQADAVILNTVKLQDDFIARYGTPEKFQALHNGYLEEDIQDIPNEEAAAPCARPDEFVFIHAGSLYGFRSVDRFLEGFRRAMEQGVFQDRKVRLVLLGADDRTADVCRRVLGRDIMDAHCVVTGRVPHHECIRQMQCAQCLLLFQQNTRVQVPRKLFEYMALRKPVLAITPEDGETARLMTENGTGIVTGDDTGAIGEALARLVREYADFCDRLAANDGYRNFEMGRLTVKLEDIIRAVTCKA